MQETNPSATTDTTSGSTPGTTPVEVITNETTTATIPAEVVSSTEVTASGSDDFADTISTAEVGVTDNSTPDSEVMQAKASTSAMAMRRQMVKQYAIAFAVILVMAGALWYILEEQGRIQTGFFDDAKALVFPGPAAVIVNGEKIPMAHYEKNYNQLVSGASAQGLDASDPAVAEEMKKQALDVLVNTELLRQAAATAGVAVTKEQIDARYADLVTAQGGEEQLTARMAELGITPESLQVDIESEILIQTHLTAAVDTSSITVTNEEVEALYKSVTSNPEIEVPPLEEVRPQVEQEIRFGKEQEMVNAYIESLRAKADIEVLI